MPRGNRTGPEGLGPMTGRAAGYCAGFSVPGYDSLGGGRGAAGFGPGGRRGWGYRYAPGFHARGRRYPEWPGRYYPMLTEERELDVLKTEKEALTGEIKAIQDRIEALEREREQQSDEISD